MLKHPPDNARYQSLLEKHRDCEQRLEELRDRRWLSDEERLEEVRLKKKKLAIKDEMGSIARQQEG